MTSKGSFRVDEDPQYGVVVQCFDVEVADQFEDFLSERNYVLFHVKFEGPAVMFYFGQASSREKLEAIIERFVTGQ
jgi:hypothetical protein